MTTTEMIDEQETFSPLHGGDIIAASERYGIDTHQWIDLSTGINPEPFTAFHVPESCYQQLPYRSPEFQAATSEYYQSSAYLPIAGTQTAIQALPDRLKPLPVLLPELGYQEHFRYWQQANAQIRLYPSINKQQAMLSINSALEKNSQQHLVIINPNNPTGLAFEPSALLHWSRQLAKDAYLIVDEAFIDLTPEQSLLFNAASPHSPQPLPSNVIVLRSFGKFFGLAGIRLGFVFAHNSLLNTLEDKIGLWQVNGPAQYIATKALLDKPWQLETRIRLARNAANTQRIIEPFILKQKGKTLTHTHLFSSYLVPRHYALHICDHFSTNGILLRVISFTQHEAILRVGVLSNSDTAAIRRIQAVVEDF